MATKPFADIVPLLGRGIVYDGNKTYVIELAKMNQPTEAGSTNLGMWLQGPSRRVSIDAGPFPFNNAYRELDRLSKIARKGSVL